jgi:putative peptidoglycan lipid II flippase
MRASTQNVAVILGVVIAAATGKPLAIAWCFTIGFDLVVLAAVCMLWREGELDPAGLAPRSVLHVLSVFVGRLRHLVAQPIADQAVVWIERFLGSASGVGTVAALDYARSLSDTVTLLVSQPAGYVVLSQGESGPGDTARRIGAIARPVLALGLPLSTFLLLFAPDIVHVTFGRGAFTPHAELLTSRTLQGIAVGLWASVLAWIIVRMLNVAGRNSRAAAIFVAAYATNAAILLGIVPWLTAPGLPSLALGLADSARGLVFLFGTALALGYARPLLVLIARALPGCAVLGVIGAFVLTWMDAGFARLAVGGAALGLVCLSTFVALMPAEAIAATRLILGPIRRARRRKDLAAKPVS